MTHYIYQKDRLLTIGQPSSTSISNYMKEEAIRNINFDAPIAIFLRSQNMRAYKFPISKVSVETNTFTRSQLYTTQQPIKESSLKNCF